jgi:GNAT superfamily N-acetyltransferase
VKASHFRTPCEPMSFKDRRSQFTRLHESGKLQLDLAQDVRTGPSLGYCVSSVSAEKTGGLESLFVDAAYHSEGIGTALVPRGFAWMDSLGRSENRYPQVTAMRRHGRFCGSSDFTRE